MNSTKKKAYKAEYELTSITKEELISKYNIDKDILGDISHWKKKASTPIRESNQVIASPKPPPDNMLDSIYEAKKDVLVSVKSFLVSFELDEYNTKAMKDVVGIIKDLESAELIKEGKSSGPTVNIAIQDIVKRYEDDC